MKGIIAAVIFTCCILVSIKSTERFLWLRRITELAVDQSVTSRLETFGPGNSLCHHFSHAERRKKWTAETKQQEHCRLEQRSRFSWGWYHGITRLCEFRTDLGHPSLTVYKKRLLAIILYFGALLQLSTLFYFYLTLNLIWLDCGTSACFVFSPQTQELVSSQDCKY